MKLGVRTALAIGLLSAGCTGSGYSASMTVVRPAAYTVRQTGPSQVAAEPGGPLGGLWLHSVIRDAGGMFCAPLKPPGFRYVFSEVSDSGLTMDVSCQADRSKHRIRVVFVSDRAPSLIGPSSP